MRPLFLFVLAVFAAPFPAAQVVVPDTLRPPAGVADSLFTFGWTVDADDATLLVGAYERRGLASLDAARPLADPKGTVFVYRLKQSGAPVLDGRLSPDRIGQEDCFSWTLDVRGDMAAVGAECEYDEESSGAVYLYRRASGGWQRESKLRQLDVLGPLQPEYYFGGSVALGSNFLVVGAMYTPNPTNPFQDRLSGSVIVYERQDGAWVQTAALQNQDADDLSNEAFGYTVAVVGEAGDEVIVVGAPNAGVGNSYGRGAIYVFARNGAGWSQQSKQLCSGTFYCGEEIDGGATGAVVSTDQSVQPLDLVDGTWQLGARLTQGLRPFFSVGVARHDDAVIALGAPDSATPTAPLILFRRSGAVWEDDTLTVGTYGAARDELVSLNRDWLIVGQPSSGFQSATSNSVLLYARSGSVATEPAPGVGGLALRLAPNPTAGLATVRITLAAPATLRTEVVDLQGRVVWRDEEAASAGEHVVALDLSRVAAGVYVVSVTADEAAGRALVVRR